MPGPQCPASARARLALLLLLPPLLLLRGGHASNLTVAVVLPLANTSYPWSWARVGPAVALALARVEARRDLLPGRTVRTVLGSSENAQGACSDTAAPLAAVDLKWEHDPALFLGPGCVYAAAPVGRFTAHWRVPLLTAGAPALGFGAKDEYALTTRAGPSHAKLGDFVVALHRRLGWERRALMAYAYRPGDDQPCFFVVEGLYMRVRDRLNITVDHVEFAEGDHDHYTRLLRTVQRKGRGERCTPAGPYSFSAHRLSSPGSLGRVCAIPVSASPALPTSNFHFSLFQPPPRHSPLAFYPRTSPTPATSQGQKMPAPFLAPSLSSAEFSPLFSRFSLPFRLLRSQPPLPLLPHALSPFPSPAGPFRPLPLKPGPTCPTLHSLSPALLLAFTRSIPPRPRLRLSPAGRLA